MQGTDSYGSLEALFLESYETIHSACSDEDGRIPVDAFTSSCGRCRGLAHAFAKLDLDGDGYISAAEFTRLYLEFFTSEDPEAPGNWFWGPLE